MPTFGQTGGLVLNQTFDFGPGGPHAYKIATLPADSANTRDHLHLVATANYGWGSASNVFIDLTFGNRAGFRYSYTLRGSSSPTQAKVAAYQNSDGTVDIYLMLADGYTTGGYTILEALQETIYSTPVDSQTATPPGTLVFDSSSPSYPPSTYVSFEGNTGLGTTSPGAKLEVNGNMKLTAGSGASITFPDGTAQATAWNGVLSGGDYAESVNVSGDRDKYEPGDVLVIDPATEGNFLKSSAPYSTAVTGIYSTKPGVVGRRQRTARTHMKEEVPMAMTGIVPTKVSAENGPIKPGDLLVTSSKAGYAMKGTDRTQMLGAVIG